MINHLALLFSLIGLISCSPAKQFQREIILQTKHPHGIEVPCGSECPEGFDCSSKCADSQKEAALEQQLKMINLRLERLEKKYD